MTAIIVFALNARLSLKKLEFFSNEKSGTRSNEN